MKLNKVVVAGGGVLGSQIAFQAAYCGFDVTIWLRSEGSISRTRPKIDELKQEYIRAIKLMSGPDSKVQWCNGLADPDNFNKEECLERVEKAFQGLKLELDLSKAVKDADIIIESMAEDKDQKISFYQKLAPCMDEKTILVTNSSTLLPSTFAKYTGRPDKYLSLHFANHIWRNNIAEVMTHDGTDQKYFKTVIDFANDIRMVALPVCKEKNGYLLNSMLVPFLLSGLDLYCNGVSDPASIDKAWKIGTGAPLGPFEIFDVVGIQTAYNIALQYQKVPGLLSPMLKKMLMPYNFKKQAAVLKQMIDEGKLGRCSGEGFYKYSK
ncbi:MAG: 3-hydroxyacyl-CoA dehydrogenase [Bacteroidales bacterium]|nr:3-hydroxyacyl-CoA dehydrogenase [Bacteroidales bacterium]